MIYILNNIHNIYINIVLYIVQYHIYIYVHIICILYTNLYIAYPFLPDNPMLST
jgi:hypothetical protein